jgi:hypothetical protein
MLKNTSWSQASLTNVAVAKTSAENFSAVSDMTYFGFKPERIFAKCKGYFILMLHFIFSHTRENIKIKKSYHRE